MEYQWYYAENQQQKGPISGTELKTLLSKGSLPPTTLVWRAGLSIWQPAVNFPELHDESANQETAEKPSEIEPLLPLQEPSQKEPAPDQGFPQSVANLPTAPVFAGFWRRFWALLLDDIISIAIMIPVNMLMVTLVGVLQEFLPSLATLKDSIDGMLIVLGFSFFGNIIISLFVQFVYSGFFLSRYGATPGKMALGIQIVRSDGSQVSFLRGGSRILAEKLSAWFLFLGYLIAVFDYQKRTLHDHLCDTRVVIKGAGYRF